MAELSRRPPPRLLSPASRGELFRRTVLARAYPRVVAAYRDLSWLVADVGLPFLATMSMALVYRGLHAPNSYVGFAVLGGAMLAFWHSVLWSMATQFSWDKGNGNLELFVIAPTSFEAILLGMAVGSLMNTTVRAAFIIVAGSLLFGVHYEAAGVLPALGVFAITMASLYCLGMTLASLFLFYGRDAWQLSASVQEPVHFLGGMYFPVRALGAVGGVAASVIPLGLGLDALRQVLLHGAGLLPVPLEVAGIALQLVVYAWLARVSLRFMEARARRDGKLVSKWE